MQRSVRLWVEQMVLSYVEAFGGRYVRQLGFCTITWPGERQAEAYSFESTKLASGERAIEHLRLGHPKVTELMEHLPRFFPGMPVPQVKFKSPGSTLDGWWSLWEVKINAEGKLRRQFILSTNMPMVDYWHLLPGISLRAYVTMHSILSAN